MPTGKREGVEICGKVNCQCGCFKQMDRGSNVWESDVKLLAGGGGAWSGPSGGYVVPQTREVVPAPGSPLKEVQL